uniref:Thromboxane A2 receptor n=1 Tax=Salarias fasciatus TaxID=181472 RepID=A0A672IBF9_SALFA
MSLVVTSFPTFSTPPILHQNLKINSSQQSAWLHNNSTFPPIQPAGLVISCFTMIFGTVSNLTGLYILAKSHARFRRQAKAPFLLLTVALLLADLGGHVIPGAFALYLHIIRRYEMQDVKPNKEFCHIFGACMVFFGLCPLLLGCAMAVERCIAITKPFFHASMVTVAHMRQVVFFLSSLALVLAILPFFEVGTYAIQFPGTWCFLPVHDPQSAANTILALVFSSLGLAALVLSLMCNILSGLALLHPRIRSHNDNAKATAAQCPRRASSASSSSVLCSLDVEMMMQLAAITVVSCVCWSPFLIHIFLMQISQSLKASAQMEDGFILLALRMASWNQILDPWVYILLRRTVLSRVCCRLSAQRVTTFSLQ